MHELSLAQRLLDQALDEANNHGVDEIETLTIELGAATHVVPRQLDFCLDAVAEGTTAASASVEFERIQPRGECDCGWRGTLSMLSDTGQRAPSVRCPDCGKRATLTAGRECRLRSIEIPEPTDSDHPEAHT